MWVNETQLAATIEALRERRKREDELRSVNPSRQQEDRRLRMQKGFLILNNGKSMRQFAVMAQVEAKMTVKKAIAIWKYKSGVHGINAMLENNYRDLTLHIFA